MPVHVSHEYSGKILIIRETQAVGGGLDDAVQVQFCKYGVFVVCEADLQGESKKSGISKNFKLL